jgi:hypothetical protein
MAGMDAKSDMAKAESREAEGKAKGRGVGPGGAKAASRFGSSNHAGRKFRTVVASGPREGCQGNPRLSH